MNSQPILDPLIHDVESKIGYEFNNKLLLFQALKCAGAEETDYDGNRRLSQLGAYLIDFLLMLVTYTARTTRGRSDHVKAALHNVKHRAIVMKRSALDNCIRFNPRSGKDSDTVLGRALDALIAAVFLDGHNSLETALQAMISIGLLRQEEGGINPAMMIVLSQSTIESAVAMIDFVPAGNARMIPDKSSEMTKVAPFLGVGNEENRVDLGTSRLAERNTTDNRSTTVDNRPPAGGKASQTSNETRQRPTRTRRSSILGNPISNVTPRRVRGDDHRGQQTSSNRTLEAIICENQLNTEAHEVVNTCDFLTAYIASPRAVSGLQQAIVNNSLPRAVTLQADRVSLQERYQRIESSEQYASTLECLRKYDILDLYENSTGPHMTQDNFILVQPNLGDGQGSRGEIRMGNPISQEESRITRLMMQQIFPDLEPDGATYKVKYQRVKRFRRIGRRFSTLTHVFGRGVLALLLSFDHAEHGAFLISDSMLLRPTDAEFRTFVNNLNKTQGSNLRKFSTAAENLLKVCFSTSDSDYMLFPLQRISTEEILQYRKGSEDLLKLFQATEYTV